MRYTLAEIKKGTGFSKGAEFVTADVADALLKALERLREEACTCCATIEAFEQARAALAQAKGESAARTHAGPCYPNCACGTR